MGGTEAFGPLPRAAPLKRCALSISHCCFFTLVGLELPLKTGLALNAEVRLPLPAQGWDYKKCTATPTYFLRQGLSLNLEH